jgi:hypothetical protein
MNLEAAVEYVRRGPMRREDARIAFSGRVRAFRTAAEDARTVLNELANVSATDVSAGGMRLETSSPDMAVGDWVAVAFSFGRAHYRVLGQAVWTSATADRTFEFAVRFISLSPAAKRDLKLAIAQSRFRTGGFLDRRQSG